MVLLLLLLPGLIIDRYFNLMAYSCNMIKYTTSVMIKITVINLTMGQENDCSSKDFNIIPKNEIGKMLCR